MLTGRVRKGQQTDLQRATMLTSFNDERRLDAVERIITLAEEAGLPITHLAMAFAIAHPGVTSAIIGPRTMEYLDDLRYHHEQGLSSRRWAVDEAFVQLDT
jgi:aryl-alcohol dehydrogenase-like predicted oxidoreductase